MEFWDYVQSIYPFYAYKQNDLIISYQIVIIQMKGKSISFAQVLKRKGKSNHSQSIQPKATLSQMLLDWQLNPKSNFTLFLGHSFTNRSKSNYPPLLSSRNDNKEAIFDSWIDRQGFANNKQNSEQQFNQASKQDKKVNVQKKIILSSRGKQSKNLIHDIKSNVFSQKSPNNMKSPRTEIQMITSKEQLNDRQFNYNIKSNSNFQSNQSSPYDQSQYDSKSHKPINSFLLNKELVASNTAPFKNMQKNDHKSNIQNVKEKDASSGELQQIIASTDSIHVQIGEMAHRIVLQQKKKQQIEEQQLLLSMEQQKRISLKTVNKQKANTVEVDPSRNQEEIQRKLREEVKKQVGNFFKSNMTKLGLPTFGSKINVATVPKAINQSSQNIAKQTQKSLQIGALVGNVGFSFSNCFKNDQNYGKIKQNFIPQIPISDVPVIPQILQIQSQRNHSQSNEEIYDFYEKWKQKQNIFYEKQCQNAPHIQSVVYNNQKQAKNVAFFNNTLTKPQKNEDQNVQIVYNTFGKNAGDEEDKEFYLQASKQKKSGDKPQILIKIPSNYKENANIQTGIHETQLNLNQLQSNVKTEILCLSASPEHLQPPEKHNQDIPLHQFSDNKEIQLEVQQTEQDRQSNLPKNQVKQQELQIQGQKQITQVKVIQQTFKPNQEIEEFNNQQRTDVISNQNNHQNLIVKQSPRQSIYNAKLNKVYSSPKDNPNTQAKALVAVSQFSTNIQSKKTQFKIPYVTIKYDGEKFNFGNSQRLDTQKEKSMQQKTQMIDKQNTNIQTFKQVKKIEEKNVNKIESYAYLNNFNSDPLKNSIKQQTKQQQKEEFQFDF